MNFLSENNTLLFQRVGEKLHVYFTMPPTHCPTLPERLLTWSWLSSWPLMSFALGMGQYILLIGLVMLTGNQTWLFSQDNWWYYLFTPVLTTYLLLVLPLVRRLLNQVISAFRPLLPRTVPYERLVSEAHNLNHRREWFAFWAGASTGWLITRPWEDNFAFWLILFNLASNGLMFGLLGWTIYSDLITARFLALLQDQTPTFNLLRPGAMPPLTRWSIGTILFLLGGMALAALFTRPEILLGPENIITDSLIILVIMLISLRSGFSVAVMAQLRILRAFILFTIAVLVGTLGYNRLEGWSLLDGLYMTIITLTTIGYGEIGPLSVTGRLFTIFLSLVAVGIAGYTISTMAAFIVEGDFQRIIRGNRMDKKITQLKDHFILCGLGRVGMEIALEFYKTRTPCVAIEQNATKIEPLRRLGSALYIQGDATKDETLRMAGIERARGLVVALGDDKDNAFVVLSGRSLNPKLRIIARLVKEENAEKLRRVGADEIVSPSAIGGLRMASMMIRPEVVNFLDEMLNVSGQTLRLEEIQVNGTPTLLHKTLGEADIGRQLGLLVVAIKTHEGHYRFNPSAQTRLEHGDILIVIGTPEQLSALQQIDSVSP